MTADLTPLLERRKALRWQLLGSLAAVAGLLAITIGLMGLTAKAGVTMFFVFGGWNRLIRSRWRKYQALRAELNRATRQLENQRAALRGSGERRDAAQGLAISEELPGGELSVGQGGEISERK
jgi:hypothetical protein